MSNFRFCLSFYVKKIDKRQTIIQAAIEVFSKNSFRDSNISEIAQRSNVAEGIIYNIVKMNNI